MIIVGDDYDNKRGKMRADSSLKNLVNSFTSSRSKLVTKASYKRKFPFASNLLQNKKAPKELLSLSA